MRAIRRKNLPLVTFRPGDGFPYEDFKEGILTMASFRPGDGFPLEWKDRTSLRHSVTAQYN